MEEILRLYIGEGLSVGEISKRLLLPYGVVSRYLKVKGVELRGKSRGLSEKEMLASKPTRRELLTFLSQNGWSVSAVNKKYNVPWKVANFWVQREGVPKRPSQKMKESELTKTMENWVAFMESAKEEIKGRDEIGGEEQ